MLQFGKGSIPLQDMWAGSKSYQNMYIVRDRDGGTSSARFMHRLLSDRVGSVNISYPNSSE